MNLIDSVFMPVGVNAAHVKRQQEISALDGSAERPWSRAYTLTNLNEKEPLSMFKSAALRSWATPLTIGTFVLMAGTGVLMFFDVVPGYVTFVHEWLSWLFIAGVVAHTLLNYRSFARHLGSGWGRASLIVFTVALAVSTLSFGHITAPQLKWPISEALIDARLSVLADLTHRNDAQLLQKLATHGVVARPDQTVNEIAAKHEMDDFHLLGLIFLKSK